MGKVRRRSIWRERGVDRGCYLFMMLNPPSLTHPPESKNTREGCRRKEHFIKVQFQYEWVHTLMSL